MKTVTSTLGDLIVSFFVQHLAVERAASPHTIASYRDTFRLLLQHLSMKTRRPVIRLGIDDLSPENILAFLEHLERQRGNTVRTRNTRLAAIRSFFGYAAIRDPTLVPLAQRVIAVPFKKAPGKLLGYLTEEELRLILAQPNRSTPHGRRDYLILALLYDSGARVQELIDLRPSDFRLDRLPLVYITGKGRKKRIVPLTPATAQLIRNYLVEMGRTTDGSARLLLNYRNEPMSRSGVTFLLHKYHQRAAAIEPALGCKSISPHTMRHTKAMHLLQAGVAPVTIKDILGHAHLDTLNIYAQADLEMKRKAIESTPSPVRASQAPPQHEPDLLAWLEAL